MDKELIHDWLAGQLARALAAAVSGMAGSECRAEIVAPPSPETGEVFWWNQGFSGLPGCRVGVRASSSAWKTIGQEALAGAGLDDASEEDCKGTYLELIQQAMSGLASALTKRLGREVVPEDGRIADSDETPDLIGVTLDAGGKALGLLGFQFYPAFEVALTPVSPPSQQAAASARGNPEDDPYAVLLDVEMPVSVSFGRAQLPLRELVKLTSGAIVELNRAISEPVELIVNNCVIARGEVVVVDGNYGVRIKQIISRRERLRTLH